jgi:hypothetical protein
VTPAEQLLAAAPAVDPDPVLSLPEQSVLFEVLARAHNARGGWVRSVDVVGGYAGLTNRRTWAQLLNAPRRGNDLRV